MQSRRTWFTSGINVKTWTLGQWHRTLLHQSHNIFFPRRRNDHGHFRRFFNWSLQSVWSENTLYTWTAKPRFFTEKLIELIFASKIKNFHGKIAPKIAPKNCSRKIAHKNRPEIWPKKITPKNRPETPLKNRPEPPLEKSPRKIAPNFPKISIFAENDLDFCRF